MKKLPLLGDITPAQFLRDYWHKKPLVIRQAIPGFKPLLSVEALAELATHDHVESRLVTAGGGHWDMQTGPLEAIPSREQKEWTLLVQGVNLHDARADALLRQFRFIPDARLDDLMVSFATDGGGVGPHFDSYDVFLLQAAGQRRWRIGPQKDLSVVEGLPLKILAKFKPNEEFVLEPGDMLYLPPHYAHDGRHRRLPDLFDRLPRAVLSGTGRGLPAIHGRLDRPAGPLCRSGSGNQRQAGRDPAPHARHRGRGNEQGALHRRRRDHLPGRALVRA